MENSKTQLEQANNQLKALAPNVTAQDRHEALIKYSEWTVIKYLKGEGTKLDTAINLLTLFKGRIEKRNTILKES